MGNILFITGMAGSGKSTVGRLVARHFSRCLYIQVDELRNMMVRGYERPAGGIFSEEVLLQFRWGYGKLHGSPVASQGVNVVIDDVVANFVDRMLRCFTADVHRVLLYPNASVVIDRIRQRGGPMEHISTCLQSMPFSTRYRKKAGLSWTPANGRPNRPSASCCPA
ncbi:MAG: AAA family ATPase [Caldilineales bacterium]